MTKEIPKNWNEKISKNWPSIIFLFSSPIIALVAMIWYTKNYGVHSFEICLFLLSYYISGLGITAGYHRYYSHRTHDAHPIIQAFYLLMGAMSLQMRVLDWARNHRIHHRYSDTELDPHNIKQGFFHAHMGWILSNHPLDTEYSPVKDLMDDKLVRWQSKYYWVIFGILSIGLPTAIGWYFGRPLGGFFYGGLLRVVLQSHAVYSINSIAHSWGKQRFSMKYEARDSWLLAIVSNGEGFHSFHHRFAFDYRNGWLWYHWDPSKWFIKAASLIGLTSNLRTASEASILQAQISTDHQRAQILLKQFPEAKKLAYEEKLATAKANLEALYQKMQETKIKFLEYKQMYKKRAADYSQTEYQYWKNLLQEQKKAMADAYREWSILTSASALHFA